MMRSALGVADWFISAPFRYLYRHGPMLVVAGVTVGFWDGLPSEEICGIMTQFKAEFWREHFLECEDIIHRKEQSFVVMIYVFLYYYLFILALIAGFKFLVQRLDVTRIPSECGVLQSIPRGESGQQLPSRVAER